MASEVEVPALRVLYRDALLLAVDKPPRMLSVPGRNAEGSNDETSMALLVRALAPEAMAVHRLDRDTSGVLLFALSREAHRALNQAFESRRAEKRYLALCEGDLAARTRCELPLIEARSGGVHIARASVPTDARHALAAVTELIPLERFAGTPLSPGAITLVEAHPLTGRTHQIRAHLAALGHPLLVDPRYGKSAWIRAGKLDSQAVDAEAVVLDRTPLHASAIRVPNPSGRGFLQIESPTPPDFARCLTLLHAARRRGPVS